MSSTTDQNPGCLTFFLGLFGGKKQKETISLESLPYRTRDDFLSPAEFSFYRVLSSVVGLQLTICAKVRLADIFYVARPNGKIGYYNRIASKHVDYLLCEPDTMKPLFAVELDDASHNRADRKERDEFVDKVFQAAGLPLVHIAAQREYNVREISTQVAPFLKEKAGAPVVPTPSHPTAEMISNVPPTPLCPKCGIPMIVRTVGKEGEHKGKQFYGCQNFPKCREMKPIVQPKPAG